MAASDSNKKETRLKKLRNKYRLIIYNDNSFEEVYSFRLNRLNLFTLIFSASAFLIVIVYLLIAYTPLKVYVIPDFPQAEERMGIIENVMRTDSIENQLRIQRQYIENLRAVLSGEDFETNLQGFDSARRYDNLSFIPSRQDSLLRKEIEEMESDNLIYFEEGPKEDALKEMHLCPPTRGIITSTFNANEKHYGTDIVSSVDDAVHAVHDGTVIMTAWTMETGFVIYIQHDNNLVSGYKHNAKIFKKMGDKVKTGESIALIGNTGEFSTGPHLHFELWHKGAPVNSEDYIVY